MASTAMEPTVAPVMDSPGVVPLNPRAERPFQGTERLRIKGRQIVVQARRIIALINLEIIQMSEKLDYYQKRKRPSIVQRDVVSAAEKKDI